ARRPALCRSARASQPLLSRLGRLVGHGTRKRTTSPTPRASQGTDASPGAVPKPDGLVPEGPALGGRPLLPSKGSANRPRHRPSGLSADGIVTPVPAGCASEWGGFPAETGPVPQFAGRPQFV